MPSVLSLLVLFATSMLYSSVHARFVQKRKLQHGSKPKNQPNFKICLIFQNLIFNLSSEVARNKVCFARAHLISRVDAFPVDLSRRLSIVEQKKLCLLKPRIAYDESTLVRLVLKDSII